MATTAFQANAFQNNAFQIETTPVIPPERQGGRIVAGWFSKKKWHSLKRDLEEQDRKELEQLLAQARYERELQQTIEAERPFGRKKWNALNAERRKAVELAASRKALEARLAQAALEEERQAQHDELLAKLDAADQQTQQLLHAASAENVHRTLGQVMMIQRMAEQDALHRALVKKAQEELDDEEALAFLVTH